MGYTKLIEECYSEEKDVIKVMDYIGTISKCSHLLEGGCNIIGGIIGDSNNIALQFLLIQEGQCIQRRLYHVVISFDKELDDKINLKYAHIIGQRISRLYPAFQSVFTLHEDTENLHIHILFNNCPIDRAAPKLSSMFNIWTIKEIVDDMTDRYQGRPRF